MLLQVGGHSASGGVINDYTDPGTGNIYRSHIFTASGSFVISTLVLLMVLQLTLLPLLVVVADPVRWRTTGQDVVVVQVECLKGHRISSFSKQPIRYWCWRTGKWTSMDSATNSTGGNSGGPTTFNNPGATPVTIEALGGGFGGGSGPSVPGGNDVRNNTYGGSGGGVGSRPGLPSVSTVPDIVVSPKNPAVNALSGCTLNHYGNKGGGGGDDGNTGEGSGGGGAGGWWSGCKFSKERN